MTGRTMSVVLYCQHTSGRLDNRTILKGSSPWPSSRWARVRQPLILDKFGIELTDPYEPISLTWIPWRVCLSDVVNRISNYYRQFYILPFSHRYFIGINRKLSKGWMPESVSTNLLINYSIESFISKLIEFLGFYKLELIFIIVVMIFLKNIYWKNMFFFLNKCNMMHKTIKKIAFLSIIVGRFF
jgi:hypothetical protein